MDINFSLDPEFFQKHGIGVFLSLMEKERIVVPETAVLLPLIEQAMRNCSVQFYLLLQDEIQKSLDNGEVPLEYEYQEQLIKLGTYFGYPPCCVQEFVTNFNREEIGTEKQIASNGTGFIPCSKHTLLILSGEITVESLISPDRVCTAPFPDEGKQEDAFEYLGVKILTLEKLREKRPQGAEDFDYSEGGSGDFARIALKYRQYTQALEAYADYLETLIA